MVMRDVLEQGITRIRTRRQRLRRTLWVVAGLLGAAVSVVVGAGVASWARGGGWRWPRLGLRPLLTGHGALIDARLIDAAGTSTAHAQFPLTLSLPAPIGWAAAVGAPLWIGWLLALRAVGGRGRHPGEARHRGLASIGAIRGKFGARVVRAAGKYTMPGSTWRQRAALPTDAFGYRFGAPLRPRAGGVTLWFDFETRLRIVARTGWGKSWRLLIPMIRQLPGAAVITSVEAEIFTATVKARMWRLPPVRFAWMRALRRAWRIPARFPVLVADLSDPHTRMAAGFPQVRWNPIVGCEHFKIATNRAKALVAGGDAAESGESSTDKFFRDSAAQVLAAWLHAAALDPDADIEDLVDWLRDTDLDTATGTLQTQRGPGYAAARSAMMNMAVHLDPAAGRTTSGVRRYLNFAVSSLASGQGRALCGDRHGQQLDMDQLIRAGGTVYLLAEVDEMETARPLLTLFAQEMFMSAERTARRMPHRRLPQTFMGVFDELYAGVRMPILPYIASVQRKCGISFAYAVQSSMDEDDMYGKAGAARLRGQTHTIVGGYDAESAQETTRRAGKTTTVAASRSTGGHRSEHTQSDDTLPESDQQKLQNGEGIVLGLGLAPFLTYTHRADHQPAAGRRIRAEIRAVEKFVAAHRDSALAAATYTADAAAAGLTVDLITEPA